jgi:hypothetical protein
MFGWFRRKPEFREFSAQFARRRLRREMKAVNLKIRLPEGFELTVAARQSPMFGAEIAESQTLKSARKAWRAQHSFKGGRK